MSEHLPFPNATEFGPRNDRRITPNDRFVMRWIDRMADRHGWCVMDLTTTSGRYPGRTPLDWGQALAREFYGPDWEQAYAADEHVPDAAVEAAKRWEAGTWPDWCERRDSVGETG